MNTHTSQNLQVSSASSELKELYKMALLARERAYCPYSKHKVGAAIRTSNQTIFSGCNVENSSFGATVCAERTAILKAVSEMGKIEIQEVMVITDTIPPWTPCGICRQVIAEFMGSESSAKDVKIHTSNLKGDLKTYSFLELFPEAFTPIHLKVKR